MTIEKVSLDQLAPLKSILCCPYTKTPLTPLPLPELLLRLPETERQRIPEGTIGAFISESSFLAYPIIGRIVNFLERDVLKLSDQNLHINLDDANSSTVKQSVKEWYDNFGWKRNSTGIYNDTGLFSQLEETGHSLYEILSHLSLLERYLGGEFFLDAASGAIAHPEYLAYSWFYKYRICVDISLTALQEADAKLQGKGFCCLVDICNLPFPDNLFDGIVSGYTIQHIFESDQAKAVKELHRVLKQKKHLCIMTEIKTNTLTRRIIFKVLRFIKKLTGKLGIVPVDVSVNTKASDAIEPSKLYFAPQDIRWWLENTHNLSSSISIEALRVFSKKEFESFFGISIRAAKFLRSMEHLFPKSLAKISSYVLIDLYKD